MAKHNYGLTLSQVECLRAVSVDQRKSMPGYIGGSASLVVRSPAARDILFPIEKLFFFRPQSFNFRKPIKDCIYFQGCTHVVRARVALHDGTKSKYFIKQSFDNFKIYVPCVELAFFQLIEEYLKGYHGLMIIIRVAKKLRFKKEMIDQLLDDAYYDKPSVYKIFLLTCLIYRDRGWAKSDSVLKAMSRGKRNGKTVIHKVVEAFEVPQLKLLLPKEERDLYQICMRLIWEHESYQNYTSHKNNIRDAKQDIAARKEEIKSLKQQLIKPKSYHVRRCSINPSYGKNAVEQHLEYVYRNKILIIERKISECEYHISRVTEELSRLMEKKAHRNDYRREIEDLIDG